jgi:hypothetical protein
MLLSAGAATFAGAGTSVVSAGGQPRVKQQTNEAAVAVKNPRSFITGVSKCKKVIKDRVQHDRGGLSIIAPFADET